MLTTTKLRVLRLKYGITLDELAEQGGVSNQQFSRLELGNAPATAHKERLAETALGGVIAARGEALAKLEQELLSCKGRLLEPVEVSGNEL